MPLIPHLRRWFAASAIALVCVVAGFYLYSRHRIQNALKQVPEKIGIEIQQSAKGFTISKSLQGRTLFKIEAGKVVQFKGGKRGELRDVEITVYGRDSARFDRISGKDFEYDAATGDVLGKGDVEIDLGPNPSGNASPDQSIPSAFKNSIHLRTTDLIFNQKTGDAHAAGEVEFSVPQANGSAMGLTYVARTSVLTLDSKVEVSLSGMAPVSIQANRLILTRLPAMVVLDHPHVIEGFQHLDAANLTAFLSPDNKLRRVHAEGNVVIGTDGPDGATIKAHQLDLQPGPHNTIRQAILWGDVQLASAANGGIVASAGRTVLDFRNNLIQDVHADQGVTLTQSTDAKSAKQGFEVTAPAMNFSVARGRLIRGAETTGPPQITVTSGSENKMGNEDETVITAGKFQADFDSTGKLSVIHGAPDSRIVSKTRGKPDQVSTSQSMTADFDRGGGLSSISQKGSFSYTDGEVRASADSAKYFLRDQTLLLGGSPQVQDKEMTTTAQTIRLNRLTGTVNADGGVKTTYVSSQPQTSPLHVTAESVKATTQPALVVYQGNVKLWQNADSVQAPSVRFDRDSHTITADGISGKRVSTSLNQSDPKGKIAPVSILADHLTYTQNDGIVRLSGKVNASSGTRIMTAANVDCFMHVSTQPLETKTFVPGGTIDKIVASGGVVITGAGRRVTGNQLVYTASDDKYVMTGGPPSIFDAEHGNVTGVSLTLFGHDARVLVEGSKQTPSVTEIRVAP